jgi:excisionase family DNA binding protein
MQNNIPNMLTIREVAATGILPEHAVRTLVREKRVPFVMIGTKALVNFTALCEQLSRLND